MVKITFNTNHMALLAGLSLAAKTVNSQTCATTWKCNPISTAPDLDADLSEWDGLESISTDLLNSNTGQQWEAGPMTAKCTYDTENIYFALEFPGDYRFNSTDNHLCAAIGFMFKMGEDAMYSNMGGCPQAMAGCDDGVPAECETYKVDIGAHWELSGTEMNTPYDVSSSVAQGRQTGTGTGNDPIANKDDEYAVSPYCRFDDDDQNADNEWAGAWSHTNPEDGEEGVYVFEMSRRLTTASTVTDAQFSAGGTYEVGVAFWNPWDDEEIGWTAINHFVTGCSASWIELELVAADSETDSDTDTDTDADMDTSEDGTPSGATIVSLSALVAAVALFMV